MRKLKRKLTMLLACMMLITTVPVTTAASTPFSDVKSSDWYSKAVTYVYQNKLMSGITTNTFGPASNLTRAMFVTILGRMEGVNTAYYSGSSFSDVPAGQWFSPYVKWASQTGIVSGYSSSYFGANDNISREQMATMIYRYLKMKGIELPYAANKSSLFHDTGAISTWARQGVERMRRTGILHGNNQGFFWPQNTANRAEAATVFMKLKQAITSSNGQAENFIESSQIQSYKGNTYTCLDINNMIRVPGCYLTSFAIYRDKIYYIADPGGTGGGPSELVRMNLNGSNKTILATDISYYDTFCIYDDKLYYTGCQFDRYYSTIYYSRSININTLTVKAEPYFYYAGTEDVWVIAPEMFSDVQYCSYPGFEYVQYVPSSSDWTEEGVEAVFEDKMYYFMKYSMMQSSIYDRENTKFGFGPYIENIEPYFISGTGGYFNTYTDNYLHRRDLVTGAESTYYIESYTYNYQYDYNAFWPIEEVDGIFYFCTLDEQPNGLNTRCYALNLSTGSIKSVGLWFES